MFLSSPVAPRVVVGAIGAGAVTGILLWATVGTAAADPPPRPANCTATSTSIPKCKPTFRAFVSR